MPRPPASPWSQVLLAAAFASGCTDTSEEGPPPSEPSASPDVLLVVLDTTRADALSAYGNPRPTSPAFDALAAEGVLFGDATAAAPWTWPSHASLFTGLGPWEHGAHYAELGADPEHQHLGAELAGLHPEVTTLAERFAAAGYRTVSLAANPLLDPAFGLVRGFQRAEHHADDRAVVELAVQELLAPREEPLLLFVNLMPAHHPGRVEPIAPWSERHRERLARRDLPNARAYVFDDPLRLDFYKRRAPEEPIGWDRLRSGEQVLDEDELGLLRDLYDGGVLKADTYLKLLLTAWGDHGVRAVTADHGEYFGEHGHWEHGRVLRSPVLNVPLVVAADGLAPERRTDPVEQRELGATLLHLAGLGDDPGVLDGSDRVLASAWPDQRVAPLGEPYERGWRLVREGDLALVASTAGDRWLFDVAQDPGMERPLDRPAEVRRLEALIPWGEGVVGEPVRAEEAMRALGYVE